MRVTPENKEKTTDSLKMIGLRVFIIIDKIQVLKWLNCQDNFIFREGVITSKRLKQNF